MGLLMVLPSLLIPMIVRADVDIPLPEKVTGILVILWFLLSFVGAAWLGVRRQATITDLFLAGAMCWVALSVYFGKTFEAPGLIALLFGTAGVVYYQFPRLGERRVDRIAGHVIFWIGFIYTFLFYNPLFEGKV